MTDLRERIARKLADLRGHRDLEHEIVLEGGASVPVWKTYLRDADAILALIPQPGEPTPLARRLYAELLDNEARSAAMDHLPTGDIAQLTADVEALTSSLERQSDYVKRVVAERDLLVKAFMPHITVAQRAALEAALSTSPDQPTPR